MRSTLCILAAMALLSAQAMADPWKDESGHGKRGEYADRDYDRRYAYDREHKEEFWDGNCKVERKWERNGDYKEERKCKGFDDK
jgi:hypothetical protein